MTSGEIEAAINKDFEKNIEARVSELAETICPGKGPVEQRGALRGMFRMIYNFGWADGHEHRIDEGIFPKP